MTLMNMTVASAATPYYFTPAKINDNEYISGDNLAVSPALEAYYHVIE